MKKILSAAIIPMLMAGMTFAQSSITEEYPAKKGQMLDVELRGGGTITVIGWDKDLIAVDFNMDGDSRRYCDVDIEPNSSGLRIKSVCDSYGHRRSGRIELEVRVPSEFALDLNTNGGNIEVDNIKGEINGYTMGGNIDLRDLTGELYLRTNGGDIKCRGLEGRVELLTNGGNILCRSSHIDGIVRTLGGNITINDVSGDFEAKTNGGNVILGGGADYKPGERDGENVRVSTLGGNIEVESAPAGADLKTNGGSIEIERAGKYVKARTLAGNIDIIEIDGWVRAETNAGDVMVRMVGDPDKDRRDVEISSLAGDVELIVPRGLSMDVDITIAYTRGGEGNYDIISDFDLDLDETRQWDRSRGSARRYIYGTGTINGGKNKIRIETINGNVYLKEGE